MYKHILIPTDGSALSRAAAIAGVKLAKSVGARVTGFHAAPPATPVEYKGMLPVGYRDPAERARVIERTARKHLEVIEKAARSAKVRCKVEHVTDDLQLLELAGESAWLVPGDERNIKITTQLDLTLAEVLLRGTSRCTM